jgi:hypothetical protein
MKTYFARPIDLHCKNSNCMLGPKCVEVVIVSEMDFCQKCGRPNPLDFNTGLCGACIRELSRIEMVSAMRKHLKENQGFPTDDPYTSGWRRGWEDAAAYIEMHDKKKPGRIEKLVEGPFDMLKSPWDEAFRKINEIIDHLNEAK